MSLAAGFWRQLMRFSAVGLLNTAIGLGMISLAMMLGATPTLANVIGYSTALPVSFLLNKTWTFEDQGRSAPQVPRFILIFIIAYGANMLALQVLANGLLINPYVAQFFSACVYSGTFFAGCKMAVFLTGRRSGRGLPPSKDGWSQW